MKRFSFFVLFISCIVSVFAQQSEWRDLIDKKQFNEVILQSAGMTPADSGDFTKMYFVGQAYEGLLKYKDAYDCYKQCYSLDSTRIDMLNTLARISAALGRIREAETFYKKVIEYDSTNFYANYQLARLYVQRGKNAEGMKYYDYLLETDSLNPILLRAKGDCYLKIDSLDEALECYYDAYYNNVENASLASDLINLLLKLFHPLLNDYYNVAFSVCDTAMYYNPEDVTLRQNRAMLYFMIRDYQKSDSIYTSLMAEGDSCFITLKYCGASRYYGRHWFDAIEPLEKAFIKDSTALDVCLMAGLSLGRTYDPKKAFEYFNKAEKIMTPDEYYVNYLMEARAEMYNKAGNCEKGSELYYILWKKEKEKKVFGDIKKQKDWLQRMHSCDFSVHRFTEMEDVKKQRQLFISYLYATEIINEKKTEEKSENPENSSGNGSYVRSILEKYREEMFFRSINEYTMIAPDNKKNTLSIEKLKEIIDNLSEK